MEATLKLQTTVLPGQRIEVAIPDFPEGTEVELLISRIPVTSSDTGENVAFSSYYPEALNAEYNALVSTQWQRALTEEEAARLEQIKAEINAIDAANGSARIWEQQLAALREQLAALRRDVEALPDTR